MVFLLALVVLLLATNFLPAGFFLTRFLKTIGNTGICMLLLAVVQLLSGAIAAEQSGITSFLMMLLDPIFGGILPLLFVLFIGFAATALTNFMNNGAVGVALMPIVYSYCAAMNANPALPVIIVVMAIHLAFLTPAASSSAALLHGNEWSETKSVWKTAPLVILISWGTVTVVTVGLGSVLFQWRFPVKRLRQGGRFPALPKAQR